jgi:hypothetical protein
VFRADGAVVTVTVTLTNEAFDRYLCFHTGLPSIPLMKWGRASGEEVGDVWAYPARE